MILSGSPMFMGRDGHGVERHSPHGPRPRTVA
jgi:hypothetical protein